MDKDTIDLTEDAVKVDIKDKGKKPLTGLTVHKEKFTLKEAIVLREKGLTLAQVGKLLGVTKQAVAAKFKQYDYCPEKVREFIDNRSSLFANLQRNILQSLDKESIKKMSGRDKVVATGILYDKERLERDLSTQNISSHQRICEDAHKEAGYT